jgi:hypothetical protein
MAVEIYSFVAVAVDAAAVVSDFLAPSPAPSDLAASAFPSGDSFPVDVPSLPDLPFCA